MLPVPAGNPDIKTCRIIYPTGGDHSRRTAWSRTTAGTNDQTSWLWGTAVFLDGVDSAGDSFFIFDAFVPKASLPDKYL
jgi:hypothetical protein